MKSLIKKVVAITCTLALCLSAAACGRGGSANNTKVDNEKEDTSSLHIMIFAKGYGYEWLDALARAFEEKNEGVKVIIEKRDVSDALHSDLKAYEYCDTDLYFDICPTGPSSLVSEFKQSYQNKQGLRDLTSLLNETIPGESITYGKKMNGSLKKVYKYEGYDTPDESDDTYYCLPYVTGALGLYYNETVINNALGKGKWSVPNTTDELKALCDRLKAKDCHIFLPGGLDQWGSSMYLSWWAQYEGYDNFLKFFEGIGYDRDRGRVAKNSSMIFEQIGRLPAMQASFDFCSYKNGYILSNSAEIGVNSLNEYQSRFTVAANKYAFYPCGDWLMQELKNNSTVKSDSVIKMMKTPVISSIINSYDEYSGSEDKRLPHITSDDILSKVIDYVDGNGALPAGVTEQEAAIVAEARNCVGTKSWEHQIYAPSFSNAKKLADQFLLFMASDEGIKIFKEHCDGGFAPFAYEYDGSMLNETEQSVFEATRNANYVGNFKFHKLFYSAGVNALTSGSSDTLDGQLCNPQTESADSINRKFINAYSGAKWDSYLSKIS